MEYPKRLNNYLLACGFIWVCMLPDSNAAEILYGGNAYQRADVIEINLDTNSHRKVGDLLFDTQAIAQDWDPDNHGRIYYFEWRNSGNRLAYWDPSTRGNELVTSYVNKPWGLAKRAAFHPIDGSLYLMDDENWIYEIDKISGSYTQTGQVVENIPSGSLSATGDMVFSPDGNLLYVATGKSLYQISWPTLQLTRTYSNILGGSSWLVWTGLGFGCNGKLYASHVNMLNGNSSSIFEIDLSSGNVTRLIDTGRMINDLTSCRDFPPVPEQPKSGCGAAPMVRDGERNKLPAGNSFGNALLPLLPPLMALGGWYAYKAAKRRNRYGYDGGSD